MSNLIQNNVFLKEFFWDYFKFFILNKMWLKLIIMFYFIKIFRLGPINTYEDIMQKNCNTNDTADTGLNYFIAFLDIPVTL